MRVVAGRLGSRTIASPPSRSRAVRPTSDRARETLFAILGDVSDLLVLDLFCGTGALAIEAISRGADSAVLVDQGIALAQRNVTDLGIANRCELVRSDAIRYLERSEEALRPHPLRPAIDSPTALSPRSPNTCRHAWPSMAGSRSSARRAARSSSICHCSPSAGSARR